MQIPIQIIVSSVEFQTGKNMNEPDIAEIEKMLEEKRVITEADVENVLNFLNEQKPNTNIACKYFFIKNSDNDIREYDFLKMIFQNIVFYILRYEEYQTLVGLDLPELVRKSTDLVRLAISKFQKKNVTSGEPGELILFVLLESQGISQLVSKMRLKTNTETPVFGADALHIQFKDNKVLLHYGEAKMYEDFSQATKSAINSIKNIDGQQRETELDLVSTYIDRGRFEDNADKIIDFLDPYKGNKENFSTIHSVFIGFNWEILKDLSKRGSKPLGDFLKENYLSKQSEYSEKIKTEISSSSVNNRTFDFYIIPFKNVGDFRNAFREML